MGIRVKVLKDGQLEMNLTDYSVIRYESFIKEIDELDIKKNNLVREVTLEGRINQEFVNGNEAEEITEIDSIRKLGNYAIIPEYVDCYKDLEIEIINTENKLVKNESYENMYVYYYKESAHSEKGVGTYIIKLRERIEM